MKKRILLISFTLLLILIVGCVKEDSKKPNISVGAYVMEESVLKPYLILKDNNEFSFTYSLDSSYWAIGIYEEDDGNVILKTIDDEFKYVFEIKDNDLIFNSIKSSEISAENVPDGSIFSFNKDYLAKRVPFIGISYDLKYKEKIFPNMTDIEIQEVLGKITDAASEKAKEGEKFKITEEELEKLNIKGLDPQYLNMIKISTE